MESGRHSFGTAGSALVVLVLGVAAAAVYAFTGSRVVHAAFLFGFSLVCVCLIAVGRRAHRPANAVPWLVLAGVQTLWLAAWVGWERPILARGVVPSPESWVNFVFLAGYPLLLGVLAWLLYVREPDGIGRVDASVVAVALWMLTWALVLHRYFGGGGNLSVLGRIVQLGYGVFDVLILAWVLRLAVSAGRRAFSFWGLLVACMLWVGSDGIWNWSTQLATYTPGSWGDVGWLLSPAVLAAAALHPSMGRLFERAPSFNRDLRLDRIALLAAAALVGPAIWIVEIRDRNALEQAVLASSAAALVLLVILRLVLVLRARARLADELAAQNERLRDLDRMKDDFVASVSHELRTPLTSIRGYLELLLDPETGALTGEQAKFLRVVDRNAERLLHLVGDLLAVAEIDSGRLSLEFGASDLAALVAESVDAARPIAADRGITLELEASPANVALDRSRFAQVVDNLLSNALKFTEPGGRVDIRVTTPNGRAMLEITDSGIGISQQDQANLFQRFYRSEAASTKAIQGTGLGLWISKAIIDAHGGQIGVESQPDRGTTFRVELPLAHESD